LNDQSVFGCGTYGRLAFTTNSGNSWTLNSRGYYFSSNSIKFFDANNGIATGDRYTPAGNGIIVRTTNSGISWDTTTIDSTLTKKIYKINNNTAYISGLGKIFKTTDKGATFTIKRSYTYARWDDICFPDENTGYVINKYKIVDKTTDGGNTWSNLMPMDGGEYFTICFINATTGFFGGAHIFKTTNGGAEWDALQINQGEFFCELIRYNNGNLYIVGNRYQAAGVLFKSSDIGNSWSLIDSVHFEHFFDISFPTPNVIYVTGNEIIYRSVNHSKFAGFHTYADGGYSKYSLLVDF